MTDTANSGHFRTEAGASSAWWRVGDRERVEITHFTDHETPLETVSFGNFRVMRYSCHGVVFIDTPTLAQAHSLLPQYHPLWCAVSEEFRRRDAHPPG
ncbi:hypothetical protein [Nocardia veterana]|uniref:Uncharacterized protein n=1 Tax=Nocardia veterana TaxID=132249 RepID=A0A7X6RLK9_9NOCA|nr:hypothetical protein [Nocardia veterana]NKY89839.1 hypothetical protein [Nocardia veterana]